MRVKHVARLPTTLHTCPCSPLPFHDLWARSSILAPASLLYLKAPPWDRLLVRRVDSPGNQPGRLWGRFRDGGSR